MVEESEFTVNYLVGCIYCKHIFVTDLDPSYIVLEEYCSHKTNRNSDRYFARITTDPSEVERMKEKGIKSVGGFINCDKFENSGMPAHPDTLKCLVQCNPKCKSIPSDISAKLNPYDLLVPLSRGGTTLYVPLEPRGKP
ncbi:hypothetical protein J4218_04850 [Candidatus Pacearchaeota archaeon]|nr:hypothetical protein [Candidatus Pacearchaeota archaeon]